MAECSGCDAVATSHPYIGVARDQTGRMAAFPVCYACWSDPSHRRRVLKMHFFDARQASLAVEAAEQNILVEPAT